ncbi:XRE family transcriptional regulator [Candidatus Poribacteria bacterium]|nr:XRE family transcriptional regulator [Candidatus Poribacteria bacterium]
MADYTMSSGNVFKDLGLPHPDERFAKAKLAYRINCFIAEKGLTQKEAASFLGISRAKMTALRNGRLNTFTIDQLFSLLGKLDHHIEIRVIPKETSHTEETITVAVV